MSRLELLVVASLATVHCVSRVMAIRSGPRILPRSISETILHRQWYCHIRFDKMYHLWVALLENKNVDFDLYNNCTT